MLNLSDGPYVLTDVSDGVNFDLNGDGTREKTAWTAPGSEIAFLAVDRNGSGRIDDGRELFGDTTVMKDGSVAANGYRALREYDATADGVVDARDAGWSRLVLWVDRNHNGISEDAEVEPIAGSIITALHYDEHRLGRRDAHGNLFRWKALYRTGRHQKTSYDVIFRILR